LWNRTPREEKQTMLAHIVVTVCLTGSSAVPTTREVQPGQAEPIPNPEIKLLFDKGNASKAGGDYAAALDYFKKAQEMAAGKSDGKELSQELILRAGEVGLLLYRQSGDRNELLRLQDKFKVVIDQGTPEQKARAYSSLAVIHLELGKPAAAIADLKACDWTLIKPSKHYLLHFNLGVAYQQTAKPVLALREFHLTLKKKPDYTPAAIKGVQIAGTATDLAVLPEAYQMGKTFLKNKHPAKARVLALQVIGNPSRFHSAANFSKKVEIFLVLLLDSYIQAAEAADEFQFCKTIDDESYRLMLEKKTSMKSYLSEFEKIAGQALGRPDRKYETDLDFLWKEQFGTAAVDLQQALASETGMALAAPDSSPLERYPWFAAPDRNPEVRRAFARFLVHAGDYFAGVGAFSHQVHSPQQALDRYLAGRLLDPSNTLSSQRLAWALSKNYQTLDAKLMLTHRAADLLQTQLAPAGDAWQKEDLENLLRACLLLGTIFQHERHWGSEQQPRSAIYLWVQAEKIERRISELPGEKHYRVPRLHEYLAQAYRETKQLAKTYDQILDAAEAYLLREERVPAEKAINQARQLQQTVEFQPTPQQRDRLATILARLKNL
jgi:hypothetical protein